MVDRLIAALFFILLFTIGGCDSGTSAARSLKDIKDSGTLIVLSENAPTIWYINREGNPTGPEYDMMTSFAEHLGVEVKFEIEDSLKDIFEELDKGNGDLAAATITITPERQKKYLFSKPYQDVTQQVVCRRDNVQPESVAELVGLDIKVIAKSSYSELLTALKKDYPELHWEETSDVTTVQLLEDVWERKIDCTVADSNVVDINRRYYPELIAPFNLSRVQQLGWVMNEEQTDLKKEIDLWLAKYKKSGNHARVMEKYYGFFEAFDYVDIRKFLKRIDSRLPKYRKYFVKAGEKYELPFTLLAAQAYQESHWNPRAKSPTGVRGIMMLTINTAHAMGVEDRLNPEQSIMGGAKYMAKMKQRFDENLVHEPDLTWLALAAYNIGRGHIHDAQTLARQQGKNPYMWSDIREVLPLLSRKSVYKKLRYGYARGNEPVRYVQRIREYRHILENEFQ